MPAQVIISSRKWPRDFLNKISQCPGSKLVQTMYRYLRAANVLFYNPRVCSASLSRQHIQTFRHLDVFSNHPRDIKHLLQTLVHCLGQGQNHSNLDQSLYLSPKKTFPSLQMPMVRFKGLYLLHFINGITQNHTAVTMLHWSY